MARFPDGCCFWRPSLTFVAVFQFEGWYVPEGEPTRKGKTHAPCLPCAIFVAFVNTKVPPVTFRTCASFGRDNLVLNKTGTRSSPEVPVSSLTVYMAVVPICYKMPYRDHTLTAQNAGRQPDRGLICDCSAFSQPSTCMFSSFTDARNRWQVLYSTADIRSQTKTRERMNSSKLEADNLSCLSFRNKSQLPAFQRLSNSNGGNLCLVCYASKPSTTDKQLDLLDSYFDKLEGNLSNRCSDDANKTTGLLNKSSQINAKEELESLNAYLGKLNKDNQVTKPLLVRKDSGRGNEDKVRSFMRLNNNVDSGSGRSQSLQEADETSDLYLINLLAAINIAVFLFEIASPIKNADFQLFSLPLLYGAKVNDWILVGQWWRLVTPMFLHAGVFHVALGCWSLLTFGPQICRGYGAFTFFLIYVLGGISGNLTSFLHTPEPTVGGTGPIFALIGAWLIYRLQNKAVIEKDVSERLFQKAIITTGLSFILSHFGPIDDWNHLGAIFAGIVYGFLTCPTLQLDEASSRTGQDEGIAIVRRYANPCKSLILFTIFVLVLSSLLFFVEPPLDTIVPDDFE